MSALKTFLKKHAKLLGNAILTIFLAVGSAVFCNMNPDYTFFITFLYSMFIVGIIIKMLFVKAEKKCLLQTAELFLLIIASNHLYSYEKLITVFPLLQKISMGWTLFFAIALFAGLAVIVKFYILADKTEEQSNGGTTPTGNTDASGGTKQQDKQANGLVHALSKEQIRASLTFIAVICVLLFIITVTVYIFNHIYNDSIQSTTLSYLEIIVLYATYGVTILGILVAVIILLFILVTAVRLIILCIRKIKHQDENVKDILPIYAVSAVITVVLFYMAYEKNDFTLNDFTKLAYAGDYLAVPLTFLLFLAAFCIFVWVIHNTLIVLMAVDPKELKDKFLTSVGKDLGDIVSDIYYIVIDTTKATLKFIRFIPVYFYALVRFVLGDEEESDTEEPGEKENKQEVENEEQTIQSQSGEEKNKQEVENERQTIPV